MEPAFPEFKQESIELLKEDQKEIRSHYKKLKTLGSEEERRI
jgi:hypothetical protein